MRLIPRYRVEVVALPDRLYQGRTSPGNQFCREAASLLDRPPLHGLCRRRIDLGDLEKAIGFGVVRSGDERTAHFGAVPSGHDAKPERLFCFDVARREILHGGWLSRWRSTIERRQVFGLIGDRDLCSALAGESGKVRKDGRDEVAMMGVGRGELRGV
jgi:hypothetical protein